MARWRVHTSGPLTPIPGVSRGEAGGIVSSVMMIPFNRPLLAGLGGQTPKGWSSDTSLLPPDGGERPPTRAALAERSAPGVAGLCLWDTGSAQNTSSGAVQRAASMQSATA